MLPEIDQWRLRYDTFLASTGGNSRVECGYSVEGHGVEARYVDGM